MTFPPKSIRSCLLCTLANIDCRVVKASQKSQGRQICGTPNDNWITACRPCYDKITRGYDGGLSEPMIATGEPMDIPMRLLKEQIDYENQMELAPHEQLWNDEADEHLKTKTNELFDYAIAQGIDPGDLLDAWHDRASMVEGLDYGEPGSELGFRAHAVGPFTMEKVSQRTNGHCLPIAQNPCQPRSQAAQVGVRQAVRI